MNNRIQINRAAIKQRKKIFFYAEDDAAAFDTDAELNTMHYRTLHNFMMELVSEAIGRRAGARPASGAKVFLDIGSGTGEESIAILARYPETRVVAVDLCSPMHEIFRRKLRDHLGVDAVSRVSFVTGDIADGEITWQRIRSALAQTGTATRFDMVVSALALHHLTIGEKSWVYRMIQQAVNPGSMFINADAFGYRTTSFDQLAQKKTLDWIRRQHDPKTSAYPRALRQLGAKAAGLARKWIDHCRRFNITVPVESQRWGRPLGSPRDEVECEFRLLVEAGFRETECPYRCWQTGIVVAVR